MADPSAPTAANDPAAQARAARTAGRALAAAPGRLRSEALRELALLLEREREALLAANARDLEAARRRDLAPALQKRLVLDDDKLTALGRGVRTLAERPDPLGRTLRRTELDRGLELRQVTSPIGVLLVIFESRPDAVVQIGALAIRSGNAVVLKGGSEALHSNRALVSCLRRALAHAGLNPAAIGHVEGRQAVDRLLELERSIDLVIPRGSSALVRSIQRRSRIPVLGHAEGICHLYLDRAADPAMATQLAVDGKCDYPAACNATETLLVHEAFLPHLPALARALIEHGVTLYGCARTRSAVPQALAASEEDWAREYGSLELAVRVVASIEEAIEHIHRYGSGHTEAICTSDPAAAETFLREVDAAGVFHNASTRFADGYRYGLGAEVGISTGRIHARGPVGVEGLLTTRWLLVGEGHVAGAYTRGERRFTHRPLPLD